MTKPISLRWVKNDIEGSKFAFGGGRSSPEFTYCGAPIQADFELTYESLVPYLCEVLDKAACLEGTGVAVKLVEIKGGVVQVW